MDWNAVVRELFPYGCALYVLDSFGYIREGWVVLASAFGRRFRRVAPGLRVLGMSPLAQSVFCQRPRIILGPRALHILCEEAAGCQLYEEQHFRTIRFADIREVAASSTELRINAEPVATLPSARRASQTAAALKQLILADSETNDEKVRAALRRSFDLKRLEDERTYHREGLLFLGMLSAGAFLWTFAVLPFALYSELGRYADTKASIGCLALLWGVVLSVAAYLHYTAISRRVAGVIPFLLPYLCFPISAPQILSSLTRHLYDEYDFTALAASFLRAPDFAPLAREELARIEASAARADSQNFTEALQVRKEALCAMLREAGVAPDQILDLQPKRDAAAASYCPVCGIGYREGYETCGDCGAGLRTYA